MTRNPAPNMLIIDLIKLHYDTFPDSAEFEHVVWPSEDTPRAGEFNWLRVGTKPVVTEREGVAVGAPERITGMAVFEVFGPVRGSTNHQLRLADSLTNHYRDVEIKQVGDPALCMGEGTVGEVNLEQTSTAKSRKYLRKANAIVNYQMSNWI